MTLDAPSQRLLRSSPVLPQQVSVADFVYSEILGAVHDGRLRPGERLNDIELADQFGVSRTPVREALQRLREIGLVEAAAARYTRVSLVDSRRTRQAVIVWVTLLRTVVDEVVTVGDPDRDRRLGEIRAAEPDQQDTPEGSDPAERSVARLFRVLDLLTGSSHNPVLRRTLSSVDHVVRLGLGTLPVTGDRAMADVVTTATDDLVDAVLEPSVAHCHQVLDRLFEATRNPDTFIG